METLIRAIERNCDCPEVRVQGAASTACGGHRMLAFDQRALDGLLFVSRMAGRLRAEEFGAALHLSNT
jgi:hypothetical protein